MNERISDKQLAIELIMRMKGGHIRDLQKEFGHREYNGDGIFNNGKNAHQILQDRVSQQKVSILTTGPDFDENTIESSDLKYFDIALDGNYIQYGCIDSDFHKTVDKKHILSYQKFEDSVLKSKSDLVVCLSCNKIILDALIINSEIYVDYIKSLKKFYEFAGDNYNKYREIGYEKPHDPFHSPPHFYCKTTPSGKNEFFQLSRQGIKKYLISYTYGNNKKALYDYNKIYNKAKFIHDSKISPIGGLDLTDLINGKYNEPLLPIFPIHRF